MSAVFNALDWKQVDKDHDKLADLLNKAQNRTEVNTMGCCADKYTCAEGSALAYAIITCILTVLTAVGCGFLFIYKNLLLINSSENLIYIHIGVAATAFFLCWITFAFSVVLAVGITKKKANCVLAAFVFGIVEIILIVLAFAAYMRLYPEDSLENGIVLAVLVVYSLPLAVVWWAFKHVSASSNYEPCVRTINP